MRFKLPLPVACAVTATGLLTWLAIRTSLAEPSTSGDVRTTPNHIDPRSRASPPLPGPTSTASSLRRNRMSQPQPAIGGLLGKALSNLESAEPEEQSLLLSRTTDAWPLNGLHEAMTSLLTLKDRPAASMLATSMLSRWASQSPGDAAMWAESLPPGDPRIQAFQQVALAWSAKEFWESWNWAVDLPNDAAKNAAILSLAYELSRIDPQGAFEKSAILPEGPERSRLVEHAVANWAYTAPIEALRQVREIGNPELRNSALGSLAISWSETDPHSAATLVADAMEPGPAQDRAVASIVQRWAQQDPDAASAWIDTFPEGPLKEISISHITSQSDR